MKLSTGHNSRSWYGSQSHILIVIIQHAEHIKNFTKRHGASLKTHLLSEGVSNGGHSAKKSAPSIILPEDRYSHEWTAARWWLSEINLVNGSVTRGSMSSVYHNYAVGKQSSNTWLITEKWTWRWWREFYAGMLKLPWKIYSSAEQ